MFREAALGGATAIVVFHNHPSGDPTPSPDDVELTRRLVAAGALMGIDVVDHVILGDARYCSFKEIGRAVSRVLYFDCFSGISGDMTLGALLDAGLPLDELKARARQPGARRCRTCAPRRCCAPACRRRSSRVHEHAGALNPDTRNPRTRTAAAQPHAHRHLPEIFTTDRRLGAVGGGARSREGDVPAARRGRGGDPPDAGREGAPARGRRPRLDHRHRRHRVRAWSGPAPTASSARR